MGKSLIQSKPHKGVSILQNLREEFVQKERRLDIQDKCKFFIAKKHIEREQLPEVLKQKKERFKRKYSEEKNSAKVVTN